MSSDKFAREKKFLQPMPEELKKGNKGFEQIVSKIRSGFSTETENRAASADDDDERSDKKKHVWLFPNFFGKFLAFTELISVTSSAELERAQMFSRGPLLRLS